AVDEAARGGAVRREPGGRQRRGRRRRGARLPAPRPILKLVTKAVFNELTNYGIQKDEMLRVASHLLDNPLPQDRTRGAAEPGKELQLTTDAVVDEWRAHRRLGLEGVTLQPLDAALIPRVAAWLRVPAIRDSFVPAFPEAEAELGAYLRGPLRDYFS